MLGRPRCEKDTSEVRHKYIVLDGYLNLTALFLFISQHF